MVKEAKKACSQIQRNWNVLDSEVKDVGKCVKL